MSRYLVRLTLDLYEEDPERVDSFFREFPEHLRDKLNVPVEIDHLPAPTTTHRFDCYVEVDADSALKAVLEGSTAIRTAACAVQVNTHKWPDADEWPKWIKNRYVEATLLDRTGELALY